MNTYQESTKYKVILIGPTLKKDSILHTQLKREVKLYLYENIEFFWQSHGKNAADLALIEINSKKIQLKSIMKFHNKFPEIPIIAIGSGKPKDYLIQAFKFGVKDFFKVPYPVNLLAERVKFFAHS